jgi:hypothetical protein
VEGSTVTLRATSVLVFLLLGDGFTLLMGTVIVGLLLIAIDALATKGDEN